MRITRVYTRAGDGGATRLVGGATVAKDDLRIEAYGVVDELNAAVGWTREGTAAGDLPDEAKQRLGAELTIVQNDLFNVGTDLATPALARWETMYRVGDTDVERLESLIDAMNEQLEPLREFILPGGGEIGARLHIARTTCRRAERRAVSLLTADPTVGEGPVRYLNRLSDYLFVAGRWAAKAAGAPEPLWNNPAKGKGRTSGT